MRSFCLVAASALALGACGRGGGDANTANQSDVVSAANIISNDVTAIDAVTADAANMAADVPIDENLGNGLDNMLNEGGNDATPKTAQKAAQKPATPKSATPPATPANEAAATNSAE